MPFKIGSYLSLANKLKSPSRKSSRQRKAPMHAGHAAVFLSREPKAVASACSQGRATYIRRAVDGQGLVYERKRSGAIMTGRNATEVRVRLARPDIYTASRWMGSVYKLNCLGITVLQVSILNR